MGSSDFTAVSETVNCVDKLADAVDLSLYMRSCGKAEYEKFFLGFPCLQSNECTLENVPGDQTQTQDFVNVITLVRSIANCRI